MCGLCVSVWWRFGSRIFKISAKNWRFDTFHQHLKAKLIIRREIKLEQLKIRFKPVETVHLFCGLSAKLYEIYIQKSASTFANKFHGFSISRSLIRCTSKMEMHHERSHKFQNKRTNPEHSSYSIANQTESEYILSESMKIMWVESGFGAIAFMFRFFFLRTRQPLHYDLNMYLCWICTAQKWFIYSKCNECGNVACIVQCVRRRLTPHRQRSNEAKKKP